MTDDQKLWTEATLTLFALWTIWIYLIVQGPRRTLACAKRYLVSRGPPRLCGYHTGSCLRQGQMAILDSNNCEECYNERKKTGA